MLEQISKNKDLFSYFTNEELEEIQAIIDMMPVWNPSIDNIPQQIAYNSEAKEILYGGSAGGGKSDLLLGLARTKHQRSLLLRRTFPDLERSLIDRSKEFYGNKSFYNGSKHVWNIPDNSIVRHIEFGHMENIGTTTAPGDEDQYASAPYDLVAFDQLEQFTEYAYMFMFSRARSAKKGKDKQRVQVISSANWVGENVQWILDRWAPWLDDKHPNPAKAGEIRYFYRLKGWERDKEAPDGNPIWDNKANDYVIPTSRTFIPARLTDNPYLDDDYKASLQLLPEPLRSALLYGDINATLTDDTYQLIPRAWVRAAMDRHEKAKPDLSIRMRIGLDVSRGGEDKTVMAPRRGNYFYPLIKFPGNLMKTGAVVASKVIDYLLENKLAVIVKDQTVEYKDIGLTLPILKDIEADIDVDIIGVGSSVYDILKIHLPNDGRKSFVNPVNFANKSSAYDKSGKLMMFNVRAECHWSLRDALDPDGGRDIALPYDLELLGDLIAVHWKPTTDGVKIEEKEDIRKRIGRSPDSGDSITLTFSNPIQYTRMYTTKV